MSQGKMVRLKDVRKFIANEIFETGERAFALVDQILIQGGFPEAAKFLRDERAKAAEAHVRGEHDGPTG